MTPASTVGPEPPPWPLAGVSSDARSAQPRASEGWGLCSLLHLAPPGSGRGWLSAAVGGGGDLRPPARASSSAGARFTRGRASALSARGESRGREAKFSPRCRRGSGKAASEASPQASGHRGPAPRSPGRPERAQGRRSLGPGPAP